MAGTGFECEFLNVRDFFSLSKTRLVTDDVDCCGVDTVGVPTIDDLRDEDCFAGLFEGLLLWDPRRIGSMVVKEIGNAECRHPRITFRKFGRINRLKQKKIYEANGVRAGSSCQE